jgi:hypothetical protein
MLQIGQHVEILQFAVSNLGKTEMFIGHEWLKLHNPSIDWANGTLKFDRCPVRCEPLGGWEDPESEDAEPEDLMIEEGDRLFMVDFAEEVQIRAFQTKSGKVSEEQSKKEKPKSFEEAVPHKYHDFKDLFEKESFDEMPPSRPWDHAIELLPNAKNLDCKIYPLSPDEQKQLDEFLDENLRTGRIRPSKSPMASPFFFIKKKDGTLRPIQDYRKLNDMTVKNRYPLPLIQELVDKLTQAQYFTKLR